MYMTTYYSLLGFGVYALLTGITFFVYPNIFNLLELPTLTDGWARIIGLLAMVIGTYYIVNVKWGTRTFAKATIFVRLLFGLGVLFLIATNQMPIQTILFGVVDIFGAIWTAFELRRIR
jgi:uncharacterized protein YjeT (DUF2065 family)